MMVDSAQKDNKIRLLRWIALRSCTFDKSQAIYRCVLFNSIISGNIDMTKELLRFAGIALSVYVHALELALSIPDPAPFNLLIEMEQFSQISPTDMVNLLGRACIQKKDDALTHLTLRGDMSNVSLDSLVRTIYDLKMSSSDSTRVLQLVSRISMSEFLSDQTTEEKKHIILTELDALEPMTVEAKLITGLWNLFKQSAKALIDVMHSRDRSSISSCLGILEQLPTKMFNENVLVEQIEGISSKALIYAVWCGLEDMIPTITNAFFPESGIPSKVMKLVVDECSKDAINYDFLRLLELLDPKEISEETGQRLYVHGNLWKNEALLRNLAGKVQINNETLLIGSLVALCVGKYSGESKSSSLKPVECTPKILNKALLYVVEYESSYVQSQFMKAVDLSLLSKENLLHALQLAVLHSDKEVLSSILQTLTIDRSSHSSKIRKAIEKAFFTTVVFREAAMAEQFLAHVRRYEFSYTLMCSCLEQSIDYEDDEMTEVLVHTFGESLVSPENFTQTIRFGSGKFLDAVLKKPHIAQENLHDVLLVAICCRKKDAVESLVYASDASTESKRKVRDELFRVDVADVMQLFRSVENHLGTLSPSTVIIKEQFIWAIQNERHQILQCLIDKFGSSSFLDIAVESELMQAIQRGNDEFIVLLLANYDIMRRLDMAKFCVDHLAFEQNFAALDFILSDRKFTFDVLEDRITYSVVKNKTADFKMFTEHLDFDSLKAENVVSIFQLVAKNYTTEIAEVFGDKFNMSLLPPDEVEKQVNGIVSLISTDHLDTVVDRLKAMNVPPKAINDSILNRTLVALHAGDGQAATSCLKLIDREKTTDGDILSLIKFIFNAGRHLDVADYLIVTWIWIDEKNKMELLKEAFQCKAHHSLDAIFSIVENMDEEYLAIVVKEIMEKDNPEF